MKTLRWLVLVFVAAALPAAAVVIGGGYIAGDGFSLAQAIADAKREHAAGSVSPFWLLVKGAEIARLGVAANEPEIRSDLAELQRRGGVVFVCRQDLRAAQLAPADLIPGVQVVRGWQTAETGAEETNADSGGPDAPLSPIRSVNRLCAQGASADDE